VVNFLSLSTVITFSQEEENLLEGNGVTNATVDKTKESKESSDSLDLFERTRSSSRSSTKIISSSTRSTISIRAE
jgi:hypothetical protein